VYTGALDITSTNKWLMIGLSHLSDSIATRSSQIDDDLGTNKTGESGTLSASEFRMFDYLATRTSSASTGRYDTPTNVERARGYWLKSGSAATLDITGSSGVGTTTIRLESGWNMIANPFYFFIDFDTDVRFETFPTSIADSVVLPLVPDTATNINLLANNALYWNDASSGSYKWGPDSNSISGLSAATVTDLQLKPWVGYWIKTNQACSMVFYPNPRTPSTASKATTQAPKFQAAALGSDWSVQLKSSRTDADATTYTDDENYVGVQAAAGVRIVDPPNSPDGVALTIKKYQESGNYTAAILSSAELVESADNPWADQAVWEVESYTEQAGNIAITVVGAENMPIGTPLKLKDLTSGEMVDLQASSSYTYASAAKEARNFELSASASGFPSGGKLKLPSACVITKITGDGENTSLLRDVRDSLLICSIGRKITQLYYTIKFN
jgi:hypothetical protein